MLQRKDLEGNGAKKIRTALIIVAVLLGIKYIFVDFGVDSAFQLSMSYRIAQGDTMFKEMWEPYQMSTFVCVFFIKIYKLLFGTTTGLVLYLQVVGLLLKTIITVISYRYLSKLFDNSMLAFAMCWLFFIVSPKDVPMPEYANMQIWFSFLMCIFIFDYYKSKRTQKIVLAALCLCATILSYPSCLILFIGTEILILLKGTKKDALLFGLVCFIAGGLYLLFVFRQVSLAEFAVFFENMLSLETSHSAGILEKFGAYLLEILEIGIVFAIAYGIGWCITRTINHFRINKLESEALLVITDAIFLGQILLISGYTIIFWANFLRYCYSLSFLAIIFVGTHYVKRLSADHFYFYLCGIVVSALGFFATIILTNLELIASVPYLLLAVMVSLVPISEVITVLDEKSVQGSLAKMLIACCITFLVFRNGYIIRPMTGFASSILEIRGIVKEGPAVGIVSEYMGAYIQNETMKEWKEYIKDGDTIYIVGESLNTLGYLYADTNYAAPSLVPTPGYNESVAAYWEVNPHKYPDVIIATCWYGSLTGHLDEETWFGQWLREEYKPSYYVDGKYWRYYFR